MTRPSLANFRSPTALARFLLTMALGLGIDLWTKVLAQTHLNGESPIEFIPGWLHFTYTVNRGAVFGIGQGQRSLFLVVSALAILFLSYLFATSDKQRFYQVVLGMLLAGVLGNLFDRYHFGYVRDMIHAIPRWPNAFPWIFNVADSLLCVGVFFMIVYSLFFAPKVPDERRGFAVEEDARVSSAATADSESDPERTATSRARP